MVHILAMDGDERTLTAPKHAWPDCRPSDCAARACRLRPALLSSLFLAVPDDFKTAHVEPNFESSLACLPVHPPRKMMPNAGTRFVHSAVQAMLCGKLEC